MILKTTIVVCEINKLLCNEFIFLMKRTGRPEGLYCLWRWTRSPAGLSWCMCACVRRVKVDLGAGLFFYIPYSIFYMPYSICHILSPKLGQQETKIYVLSNLNGVRPTRTVTWIPGTVTIPQYGFNKTKQHTQSLTTVSPLCHGQGLVNDIRPMELGKTWDPCRISRKFEIAVVSDAGS